MLRIALVASLGVFLTGLFVLPSLAGDELRLKLADVLKVNLEPIFSYDIRTNVLA
jgi:hypothetical protein